MESWHFTVGQMMSHRSWSWETDGLRVIPGFLDATRCQQLRTRAAQIVAEQRASSPQVVFETDQQSHAGDEHFASSGGAIRLFFEEADPQQVNKIGHALHDLDPAFAELSRQPGLAKIVDEVGIAQPRLVQSMYIFKAPGVGGAVNVHQDASFLRTEPASVVGLWFALHDADPGNGCLWALPGRHREPVRSVFGYDAPDGGLGTTVTDARPWDLDEAVPIGVPMGTLVVLHGRLPHFSRPNRSRRPRDAYALHVVDGAATWSEANWLRRAAPFRGFD
ncbi:MAG: phytanoyl-CoA dioxygenase family protein [Myxococcota bacterium]